MGQGQDLYEGREHSKIKHLFLADYLKIASFKVLQGPWAAGTFTYVDGFAGPWSVADEEKCYDSSFDYAVRVLKDTQEALRAAGRSAPRLKFLLCEKDPEALKRLRSYAAKQTGIEIKVFGGYFEDNLDEIRSQCDGFTFSFIDPKGWSLRSAEIAAFLSKLRGDFLINFMEHPISRHNSLPAVQQSFARFLDDPDWDNKIREGDDAPPREMQILGLLKDRLRLLGAAKYMPDFPIKKPTKERIQMRLILGTNHVQGVEVFRTVERTIESVQVQTRRDLANRDKLQQSIFDTDELNRMDLDGRGVGGERNLALAHDLCREIMATSRQEVRFDILAARVMERVAVRMTNMKDVVAKLRSEGLLAFDLQGRGKKPQDDTLIRP